MRVSSKLLATFFLTLLSFSPLRFTDDEIEIIEKENSRAGVYPVTLKSEDINGNEISKTVNIIVKMPNTIIDQISREAIDATDFKTTYGVIEKSTSSELIELSRAHAWDTKTGEKIAITNVEVNKLKEHEFEISFSTKRGTTSSVTALEFEKELLPSDLMTYRIKNNFIYRVGIIAYFLLLISIIPLLLGIYLIRELNKKIEDTYEFIYKNDKM